MIKELIGASYQADRYRDNETHFLHLNPKWPKAFLTKFYFKVNREEWRGSNYDISTPSP